MGTQKLVSWTSNSCTVLFISAILAVSVTIAVETGRNTEGILTTKLTNMAGWKIWNCNKTCIFNRNFKQSNQYYIFLIHNANTITIRMIMTAANRDLWLSEQRL